MKIISWNVNGIRAVERKGALEEFLKTYDPDVLLIQEIKSKPEQVTPIVQKYADYQQWYHAADRPGYAGTAIWVRRGIDATFTTGMPRFDDDEGRISRVSIGEMDIFGVYFPNGGKSPQAWDDKLVFYKKFHAHVAALRAAGRTVIFAGDVNCAHAAIDLARPADNDGKIGFHPDERAALDEWVADGWMDVWRHQHPQVGDVYSWWHVITHARERNVGWRLDYFFVDKKMLPQVKNIAYLTEQMGSDHCPVLLEIS